MTGREYLFSLSDKELANFLSTRCKICIYLNRAGFCAEDGSKETCEAGQLAWLAQEYREEVITKK